MVDLHSNALPRTHTCLYDRLTRLFSSSAEAMSVRSSLTHSTRVGPSAYTVTYTCGMGVCVVGVGGHDSNADEGAQEQRQVWSCLRVGGEE